MVTLLVCAFLFIVFGSVVLGVIGAVLIALGAAIAAPFKLAVSLYRRRRR